MPPPFWVFLFCRKRERSNKFRSPTSHLEKRARSESPLPARLESPLHNDDKQKKPPPLLPNIPESIIFSKILPFLSFDELAELKLVCKGWHSFISSNPMLPLDRFQQSNYYYSGLLFPDCDSDGRLVFLPTSSSSSTFCGAHDFLNVNFSSPQQQQKHPCERLMSTTNGLLCLKVRGDDNIVYICNPSTKEGHVVQLSNSWPDDHIYRVTWRNSIGLAYDPRSKSSSYKLVCPRSQYEETYEEKDNMRKKKKKMVFRFEVFSSETNEWEKSPNECYIEDSVLACYDLFGPPSKTMKSTYAGGVLYWNCCFYMLSFDPEKGNCATICFPFHPYEYENHHYEIGEFEGHVTLSRVSAVQGMQLWILHDSHSSGYCYWELMHQVSFETVMETNPYVYRSFFDINEVLLRKKKMNRISSMEVEVMEEEFDAKHLPYGGGQRLFVVLDLEKGKEKDLLCYDADSGNLNKFCTLLLGNHYYQSFLYRSSMLSLPKLEGKP